MPQFGLQFTGSGPSVMSQALPQPTPNPMGMALAQMQPFLRDFMRQKMMQGQMQEAGSIFSKVLGGSTPMATSPDGPMGATAAATGAPDYGAMAGQLLQSGNPFAMNMGMNIQQQLMGRALKEPDKPILQKVPDAQGNEVLMALDPRTYEPLRQIGGTSRPSAPTGMRYGPDGTLEAIPGYVSMRQEIAAAGRPSVSIENKQETEEAKAVGKFYGEAFADIQKGAASARQQNAQLGQLSNLLEGVQTGKLTPAVMQGKQIAKSLGIDLASIGVTDDVAPMEAAQAIANQFALTLRNPSGGAGMPGAMSDKDREFLVSMVPGITQTPEGRKLLTEAWKKVNNRNIEVAKLAAQYRNQSGRFDSGFDQVLSEYAAKNPLFSDGDFDRLAGAVQNAPAQPMPGQPVDYRRQLQEGAPAAPQGQQPTGKFDSLGVQEMLQLMESGKVNPADIPAINKRLDALGY